MEKNNDLNSIQGVFGELVEKIMIPRRSFKHVLINCINIYLMHISDFLEFQIFFVYLNCSEKETSFVDDTPFCSILKIFLSIKRM